MTGLDDVSLGAFLVFWGAEAFLVVATFFGFLLWFMMVGIRPFSTTLRTFITILTLIFSILPGLNLFPWIVIWVFYMGLNSLFSGNK